MADPDPDRGELLRALERIARYAEGMMRHLEHHGFGESRSWRMIVHEARRVVNVEDHPLTGAREPPIRTPADADLERLLLRCRLRRQADDALSLPDADAHDLLEQLATELLSWRQSHPGELPG